MKKNLIMNKDGMRKVFFASAYMNRLATKQDVSRLELKLTEHDGEFKLIK